MKFDRRRFLLGAGGAMLALPMLESLMPRLARAEGAPKRFIVLTHPAGAPFERWQPAVNGDLPTDSISPILAPLTPYRDKITVISGIDNPFRFTSTNADGHASADSTLLTAAFADDHARPSAPSIDFVFGGLLQGTSPRRSVLFYTSVDGIDNPKHYGSAAGQIQSTQALGGNPRDAAMALFANVAPSTPPPAPSRRDRLRAQRQSTLDAVVKEVTALRGRLPGEDRGKLDAYTEFLHELEKSGIPLAHGANCMPPGLADLPDIPYGISPPVGARDRDQTIGQITNIVQAFACDITRCAALHFNFSQDPRFPWLFGDDPSRVTEGFDNWHNMGHNGWKDNTALADNVSPLDRLTIGRTFYSEMLALLIDKLSTTADIDGQPMLDNTLILSISEFGNAGDHQVTRLPVVLAGLGSAFKKGVHLDLTAQRPTTGDLYTKISELLGYPVAAYGSTGYLVAADQAADATHFPKTADYQNFFEVPYPLHNLPLPL